MSNISFWESVKNIYTKHTQFHKKIKFTLKFKILKQFLNIMIYDSNK